MPHDANPMRKRRLEAVVLAPGLVQVGERVFALNDSTGLAHVKSGPMLPGASGLGRQERDRIREALPPRQGGVESRLGWQLTDDVWLAGERRRDPTEHRERRCQTDRKPEVVFTMGLPGAGKSSTLKREGIAATHTIIDSDEIAKGLPGYDPKAPERTHEQAKKLADQEWQRALASGEGRWVVDGTGTSAATMIRRIRVAKRSGFYTRILYIRTSLATALARNKARARTVPEHIIHEKAREIDVAVAVLMDEADCFTQINND